MKLRILLVEDDDDDANFIRYLLDQLADLEVELIRERDYEAGLRTLVEAGVHACLVDYCIGGASGVDFVRKLKSIGCSLPMILLTGAGSSTIDQAAQAAGAANYLEKGDLDPERLGRALRYATRHQQSPDEPAGRTATPALPWSAPPDLETPSAGTQDSDHVRILLIEDDEDDYLLTRELLRDVFGQNLLLKWVQSWRNAQDLIFEGGYDVVIIDYRLGERNGLELVREAVQLGGNAPFIVLTGEGSRDIDLEAMRAGATDYLVKGEITAPLLDRSIRYAIERHRAERRLTEMAQIDQLTGLANRYRFRDFFDRSIARADRQGHSIALMLVDLNRFKAVNDTYGHAAGDLLLQEIARRLLRSVRPSDMVARLGGDEFTIVMNDITDVEVLTYTARRILDEVARPVSIGNCNVDVGATIGIAVYPHDATSGDALIVSADTAMYSGKGQPSGSFHFYTAEMHRRATQRLDLEKRLRQAVHDQQFELFFQPQVDLTSGRLIGFEALLRWHHPDLGLIAPGEFIELAEESSLILPIGKWALEATCAQLAAWRIAGLPEVHTAVNFSARQFHNEQLIELVAETLDRHNVPARLIEIEITESDILQEPGKVYAILDALSELGIRIALDDFGTGYSSLNHLRAFPGAIIKIDRSFIRDIEFASDSRAIVQSLIAMAHDLDLRVVAEGVESINQLNYLKERRCDVVQGFLISEPLPVAAIGPDIFSANLLEAVINECNDRRLISRAEGSIATSRLYVPGLS